MIIKIWFYGRVGRILYLYVCLSVYICSALTHILTTKFNCEHTRLSRYRHKELVGSQELSSLTALQTQTHSQDIGTRSVE